MITNAVLLKLCTHQNIISAVIRMFASYRLSFRAGKCKKDDEEIIRYIGNSINEGDTVLDVGSKEGNYIYFMRKKLRESGKIIAFESQPYLYQHLFQLKKILSWKNVEPEFMKLSNSIGTVPVRAYQNAKLREGAVVIDIKDHANRYVTSGIEMQTLDNYCATRNVKPKFLKIDASGYELKILLGAINTLKMYKPKILLRCEERIAGAEKVLETFNVLKQLNYNGYFVLDTIRIPLVNFDFNVYQNPCKNFYCSDFMFE